MYTIIHINYDEYFIRGQRMTNYVNTSYPDYGLISNADIVEIIVYYTLYNVHRLQNQIMMGMRSRLL